MKFTETDIHGCYLIQSFNQTDNRGEFVKIYNSGAFDQTGFDFQIREIYYSTSKKNVLRGFHFQIPPADHTKLVHCLKGAIADFIFDMRMESPSYGKCICLDLNDENKHAVLIPKGCAHGFLSLEDDSIVAYMQETVYEPTLDRGILWSSLPIPYEIDSPILSERDSQFPEFEDFKNPFK